MERKIGEIFEFGGEWYQCVEGIGCFQCVFNRTLCVRSNISRDIIGNCSKNTREDGYAVIFKKLEKVGEPYTHYCPSGRIIYFQRYKLFYKLYSHNTEYIMCDFNEDGIISIEIKQNKGDMEEKKLNLKPFDLQKAREGKPVCTRDGRKARIICFDSNGGRPIVALVTECDDEEEIPYKYHCDGSYNCHSIPSDNDLMMLTEKKEGWVNVYNDNPIYDTKERAELGASTVKKRIGTFKIFWEE